MGLMFHPRGGSAQVARYLSRALVESGWEVVLASGSLGLPGEQRHAATFFEGLHVEAADYTPALERFGRGEDQLAGPVPSIRPVNRLALPSKEAPMLVPPEEGLAGLVEPGEVASNGPGAFSGPFVGGGQALLVLASYLVAFLVLSGWPLRRRDVA